MFIVNEDKSIYATRGDIVFFDLVAKTQDGTAYTFQAGSVLRMRIFKKKDCSSVVMLKDFTVESNTETVAIHLGKADTKFGGIINKPTDYWYEIELNPDTDPQTIVGYGDDGPVIFRLLPEGKDIDDGEIGDEEIKSEVIAIIEKIIEKHIIEQPVIENIINNYLQENPVINGKDGKDGLTPHIGYNGNWWIGITDTGVSASGGGGSGSSGSDGSDGSDGEDGSDGKDGKTPMIRINSSTKMWELSYDNGETWASLGVSAQGADGKNGTDGADGYTPVKGVDYNTEEDKQELVQYVKGYLPGLLTVTIDRAAGTASHSASEIKSHREKGEVVLSDGGTVQLYSTSDTSVSFSFVHVGESSVSRHFYHIDDSKKLKEEDVALNLKKQVEQLPEKDKEDIKEDIGASGEDVAEDVFATLPVPTNMRVLKGGSVIQITTDFDDGTKETLEIQLDAYDKPMYITQGDKTCYVEWEGFSDEAASTMALVGGSDDDTPVGGMH